MYEEHKLLTRQDIDSSKGIILLEFGANWCGHCKAAQAFIQLALQPALKQHSIKHIKVEDGPGLRLGRLFKVKLWPTLIMIQDGIEKGRVVRPQNISDISTLLESLNS